MAYGFSLLKRVNEYYTMSDELSTELPHIHLFIHDMSFDISMVSANSFNFTLLSSKIILWTFYMFIRNNLFGASTKCIMLILANHFSSVDFGGEEPE